MQTIISIIDRKTNLQVYSSKIDLENIKESNLSPTGIFDYIWENALENEMLGDRCDYFIQLFNQRNHIIDLHVTDGKTLITEYDKTGGNKGSVICLQDYKNHKLRRYAG
ncbi:MAG: hypothetical protein K2Q13_05585 [Nitrosomonas sp.]|uniref:hypothetical protein n=1 Tax=Nitrosomonas sp. TaxID=42353 RepID=UPI0025CF1B73|nr:hypothetical protein [Nitrosomonas sp.]MBY0474523.1 hypothetical protein [Nitrosomonas sp.]